MYYKVKIKKLPNKAQGGLISGNKIVPNQTLSFGGADMNTGPKDISVRKTIGAVPREDANLEAEGGETVYGDINGDGMAEHLTIKGPRHSAGGVPLKLPEDSFIFSDTKSMKITDCKILSMFRKPCDKGGFTPATLAKQYDVQKYRKLLQDPDSDMIDKKTAEMMIRNYTMKLGALAIAQESKKGFPQGIPMMARPYMEANGISDEDLIPELAMQQMQQQQNPQEEGMEQGMQQNPQEEMMEAPAQMPNGEPIAVPQAAEGMEVYSSPFDLDPKHMKAYMKDLKYLENSIGSGKKDGKWFPYKSIEPGAKTIAYGHKLMKGEKFSEGLSEKEAEALMKRDVLKHQLLAKQNVDKQYGEGTFDKLPQDRQMLLVDYQYNVANGLNEFPSFTKGVVTGDKAKMKKEYVRGDNSNSERNKWTSNIIDSLEYGGLPKAADGVQVTPEEQKIIDTKWNGNKKAYLDYTRSKKGISGNTKLVDAMYNQYQKDIANKANYTQGKQNEQLYSGYQPELAKLTKEQMVEQLLAQEERNARLNAYGLDPSKTDQRISQKNKGTRTNQQALDLISKTPGLSDLDFSGGYKGQAAYIAYRNALNQPEFKRHGQFQTGVGDETVGGIKGQITGIDNANTNTTLGQRLNYQEPIDTPEPKPTPCKPCPDGTTPERDVEGKCPCGDEEIEREQDLDLNIEEGYQQQADWMTPDKVNYYGALKEKADINKYLPNSFKYNPQVSNPIFLDPTREIAQQSENANLMTQAMSQYAGPQQLMANASGIQGNAAEAAANTASRINNQNVNIANQFSQSADAIMNDSRLRNAMGLKQLTDQTTAANQAYDNAKRAADRNVRSSFNTGWKNASDLAMVNGLSEQYEIDPTTGSVYFENPKNFKPEVGKNFDALFTKYRSQGLDPDQARKNAQAAMGQNSFDLADQAGKKSKYGGIMKKGGSTKPKGGFYVMGDTVFPFMFY
jgi:hypothetical protein